MEPSKDTVCVIVENDGGNDTNVILQSLPDDIISKTRTRTFAQLTSHRSFRREVWHFRSRNPEKAHKSAGTLVSTSPPNSSSEAEVWLPFRPDPQFCTPQTHSLFKETRRKQTSSFPNFSSSSIKQYYPTMSDVDTGAAVSFISSCIALFCIFLARACCIESHRRRCEK